MILDESGEEEPSEFLPLNVYDFMRVCSSKTPALIPDNEQLIELPFTWLIIQLRTQLGLKRGQFSVIEPKPKPSSFRRWDFLGLGRLAPKAAHMVHELRESLRVGSSV